MAHLRGRERAKYVERMFSRISRRYDFVNTVITGGMHYRWRLIATKMAVSGLSGPALDVATGTGDFVMELARRPDIANVVGLDFSEQMLSVAETKAKRKGLHLKTTFILGDALDLPFPDDTFVSVTSGFSLRNIIDVPRALREMARVTKSGGRLAILEITPIQNNSLFAKCFRFYFRRIVPWLGVILVGDRETYTYLPESAEGFPDAGLLARIMEEAGWANVTYRRVGMGSVAIHLGKKTG